MQCKCMPCMNHSQEKLNPTTCMSATEMHPAVCQFWKSSWTSKASLKTERKENEFITYKWKSTWKLSLGIISPNFDILFLWPPYSFEPERPDIFWWKMLTLMWISKRSCVNEPLRIMISMEGKSWRFMNKNAETSFCIHSMRGNSRVNSKPIILWSSKIVLSRYYYNDFNMYMFFPKSKQCDYVIVSTQHVRSMCHWKWVPEKCMCEVKPKVISEKCMKFAS